MLALTFGLSAALIWAVHDLMARKLSQGAALLPIIAVVLASGCVALAPVALIRGNWQVMTGQAVVIAAVYGLCYAVASGALYKAFSIAPVRLVSPVIGSYPLLSLGIAAAQGRAVTTLDWLAVAAIVTGIAIVALSSREDGGEGYAAAPATALAWATFSAVGFAASFALGQEATRQGAEFPVMLIGRLTALLVVLGLALRHRSSLRPVQGKGRILILMGAIDALALGLVTAAGTLPKAEYASVAASLFGVLTVILAAWFLKERTRPVQWLGIAAVFSGIAGLSLQH